MTEMDFELIIGPLPLKGEPPGLSGYVGCYYHQFKVIAVDNWTGDEKVEYMTDILSHEFIHHLLGKMFGFEIGRALDNFRMVSDWEIRMIKEQGLERSWGYLTPVAKFSIRCSALQGKDDTFGNGVI